MLRIASVVAGLVVVLAAGRAEACSCNGNGFAFEGVGLPRNAQLPVLGASVTSTEVRLLTRDGMVVPTRTESVAGGVIVIPQEPLAANTSYVLQDRGTPFEFTTSTEDDLTAPAAPLIGDVAFSQGAWLFRSTCDLGGEEFRITVQSQSPTESFEVLEVFAGPRTDAIDTSAPALVVPHRGGFSLGNRALCSNNFPVSTLADLAVQVRSRDAAGNVSEFSNAVQLKSGGCSAAGSALGLGWMGLAFARARRRRA